MVEPQEDVIEQMMSQFKGMELAMKTMKETDSDYFADRAAENINKIESFQVEVNEEASEILERVERLRAKFLA